MIIHVYERSSNVNINRQVVRVLRVYNRNIPDGITADEFTQKGGMLVGSAAGAFAELAPGSAGQYLTPDPAQPLGLKWAVPSLTIDDSTNWLMNGGFNLAQRQAPGTLTTISDSAYGPDRWKTTRENADLQYIRQDASSESGLVSPYYGQFRKITNAGKFLICQPLEYLDTLKFRGKSVNFQLQMKASSSKTIKTAIVELQSGGTANTIPSLVSSWNADGTDPTLGTNLATIGTPSTCSVTTSWQTFQFTGTFPASSKNLLLMVWTNADFSVNDTLSLAEAGLYFGTTIRSWVPRHISQEIALCQRYYEKSYNLDVAPGTASNYLGVHYFVASSTKFDETIEFKVRKRAAPTITVYSPATGTSDAVRNVTGVTDLTTIDENSNNGESSFLAYKASGVTDGSEYAFQWVASAEL